MRLYRLRWVTAPVLLVLAACGNERGEKKRVDAAETSTPVQPSQPPPKVNATCPPTGLWAVCTVEKRLQQSGFVARRNDSTFPLREGFSVKPEIYTLNRSRLEVYLYPDESSLRRDVAKIDTARTAPVFIRSGNLAALFFTDDATQAERLSLALTAGAPQPQR